MRPYLPREGGQGVREVADTTNNNDAFSGDAILNHFEGEDPAAEVLMFCLEHGYSNATPGARAELATCTSMLGDAMQSRLTQLTQQRIREVLMPSASTAPDSRVVEAGDASVVMRVPVEIGEDRTGVLELLDNETPGECHWDGVMTC